MLIILLSFYLSASPWDHPLTPYSALYPLLVHKEGTDCLLFCVLSGCLPLWKIGAKRMTLIKQFLRKGLIWVVLQKVDSSLLCFCLWFFVLGRKFYKWKDLLDPGQRMYMNSSLPSSDIHITWVFSLEPESYLSFSQYSLQYIRIGGQDKAHAICHLRAQAVIASRCSLAHPCLCLMSSLRPYLQRWPAVSSAYSRWWWGLCGRPLVN